MDALILQLGSRQGRVAEIARSRDDELTVGRGYDNELVLTDPHVAPQQLRLFREGESWFAQVLDRTNPVLLNSRPVGADATAVQPGDELTVGRTRLLVHAADQPVEPTRKLALSRWLALEHMGPLVPLAFVLVTTAVDLLINYLFTSTTLKWSEQGYVALWAVVIYMSWAGLWAIAGRIVRHQHHFGLQLVIVSGVSLLLTFLVLAGDYISFYTYSHNAVEAINWAAHALALIILLRLNFLVATNIRRTYLAACLATAVLLGVTYGFTYAWEEDEMQYAPTHSNVLVPPPLLLTGGVKPDAYFTDVALTFEAVAETVEQE